MADLRWVGVSISGGFGPKKLGASIMADLHHDFLQPKKLGDSIMADLGWVGVSISGGFGPKKKGASIMADLGWVEVSILGGFGPKKMELPSWRTSILTSFTQKVGSFHHGGPRLGGSLHFESFWAQKDGASIMADLGWVGVSISGGFGPKKLGASIMADLRWVGVSISGGFWAQKDGASIMADLHLDVLHPKKMELPSWRTSVGWESPF